METETGPQSNLNAPELRTAEVQNRRPRIRAAGLGPGLMLPRAIERRIRLEPFTGPSFRAAL